MRKLFFNKRYYFFTAGKRNIVMPLPGDLLIELGNSARQIYSVKTNSAYLDESFCLDVEVFGDVKIAIGVSGKKIRTPSIDKKEITLLNISDFKIMRGMDVIFPITFKYKILNPFYKVIHKLKNLFKK